MRKVLIILITAALAFATAGGSSSARADDRGADWLAAGTATLVPGPGFGEPMLHVNAQSNSGGASVRGHFWIRYANGGGEFGGPVVCLNVLGQVALLYGQIERVKTPRPSFTVGSYVPIRLLDGGEPGTLLDGANFDAGTPLAPDSQCAQNAGFIPINQGNYVVHDHALDLFGLSALLAQFEAAAADPYGG
jgi:hypothetical protein